MSGLTNYPFGFSKGGVDVEHCKVVGNIDVSMGVLDSTDFDSGGYAEADPDGLIRMAPFTVEVLVQLGDYEGMYAEMLAKTKSTCVVTHPLGAVSVNGFYSKVSLMGASAEKPDLMKVIATIQPSGTIMASEGS